MQKGFRQLIEALDPQGQLHDFSSWAGQLDDDPVKLWRACPRGDWLGWLLASLGAEPKALLRAVLECARVGEACIPSSELAPRRVLREAEVFLGGRADSAACVAAGDVAAVVASVPGTDEFVRAAALSCFWLSRVVARAAHQPAPALGGGLSDAATEVRLALWQAAAACALDLSKHESDGAWLARCLDGARLKSADLVREYASFAPLRSALSARDAG